MSALDVKVELFFETLFSFLLLLAVSHKFGWEVMLIVAYIDWRLLPRLIRIYTNAHKKD